MRLALITLLCVAGATIPLSAQTTQNVEGAWRLSKVVTSGPNATTNNSPQPALYLFTGTHYSITRVLSSEPRPNASNPGNMTGQEALDIWGPFQAQAGSYEIVGQNLNLHPTVAKNPQAMTAGRAPAAFRFVLDGNTLTLTTIAGGADEPAANAATFTLVRLR